MAIVPVENNSKFVALFCTEMPEPYFAELMTIQLPAGGYAEVRIDHRFLDACEPGTIQAVSCVPDSPICCTAGVINHRLWLRGRPEMMRGACNVAVLLMGLRRGHTGKRFREHTYDEMEANMRFWGGWNTSR